MYQRDRDELKKFSRALKARINGAVREETVNAPTITQLVVKRQQLSGGEFVLISCTFSVKDVYTFGAMRITEFYRCEYDGTTLKMNKIGRTEDELR